MNVRIKNLQILNFYQLAPNEAIWFTSHYLTSYILSPRSKKFHKYKLDPCTLIILIWCAYSLMKSSKNILLICNLLLNVSMKGGRPTWFRQGTILYHYKLYIITCSNCVNRNAEDVLWFWFKTRGLKRNKELLMKSSQFTLRNGGSNEGKRMMNSRGLRTSRRSERYNT